MGVTSCAFKSSSSARPVRRVRQTLRSSACATRTSLWTSWRSKTRSSISLGRREAIASQSSQRTTRDRIASNKEAKEEENGWDEAMAEFADREWEKVETSIEEVLDETEELIQ